VYWRVGKGQSEIYVRRIIMIVMLERSDWKSANRDPDFVANEFDRGESCPVGTHTP